MWMCSNGTWVDSLGFCLTNVTWRWWIHPSLLWSTAVIILFFQTRDPRSSSPPQHQHQPSFLSSSSSSSPQDYHSVSSLPRCFCLHLQTFMLPLRNLGLILEIIFIIKGAIYIYIRNWTVIPLLPSSFPPIFPPAVTKLQTCFIKPLLGPKIEAGYSFFFVLLIHLKEWWWAVIPSLHPHSLLFPVQCG